MKHKKRTIKNILLLISLISCIIISGCGKNEETPALDPSADDKNPAVETASLADMNEIPEDGIITKEMFETVAGQDKKVSFHGSDASGIEYTWTYDCNQIQNPEDQNLKITFTTDGLDDVKKNANNANDALMMTMNGKGLICVPTLEITLPESWKSDTVLLLKEQNGKLAKMSDVTIESTPKDTDAKESSTEADSSTAPVEGSTKMVMNVTTLDGDCYLVGGIVNVQNPGAKAANDNSGQGNDSYDNNAGDNGNASGGNSNSGGNSSNQSNSGNGDVKNEDVANDNSTHYCTISISCKTILNNMGNLTAGKEEFVPSNGWILKSTEVEFKDGDSVHDVLKAVCKAYGIHMESSYTPAYNSAYVEGINQLYEFDCGELSGWMYNVNGWFPNYGCSKYTVQDGDVINWVYTCDLGKDVGDNSMY